MVAGRRSDPPGVKAAKGNTRRQAKAKQPVAAPKVAGAAAMPAFLDTAAQVDSDQARQMTGLTRSVWEFVQPELAKINFYRLTDQFSLARFCRYMAEWVQCTLELEREGYHYETTSKHMGSDQILKRPHPANRVREKAEQSMRMLEGELGLTPAARQRLMMQLLSTGLGLPKQGNEQPLPGEMFPAATGGAIGVLNAHRRQMN